MNQTTANIGSRRDFLKSSTAVAAGAALAMNLGIARSANAAGSDTIRIALIGCGGRGTGAAGNALQTKANVKLVAMADAFENSLNSSLQRLQKRFGERVDVPAERRFVGLDAYRKAIASDVDVVLLCTPPGFRPMQFEAAVKAGKHVFMEKPVATDAPGVRRIMAANEEAKKKQLGVAVGHQFRHITNHLEVVRRSHDGLLGDLNFLRVYYTTGAIWVRPRQPDQTEMQYQVRNWYHFTWLSGDHIVEQHVHDIDMSNWIAQAHPVEAQGMGGRQVCVAKDCGEIYDHHAVEFTFANGLKTFSFCRQISDTWQCNMHFVHGAKGRADSEGGGTCNFLIAGQPPMQWKRRIDGHQVEMDDFFGALVDGRPYNEAGWATESTMTAILGRMATYSGKVVTWDEAIKSELSLMPKDLAWDGETIVKPGVDGFYASAMPGTTKAW